MKKICMLIVVLMLSIILNGCMSNAPSFQSETTVLGMEVESMGSLVSGESPLPKLRFGLIRHKGQIVQKGQVAYLYSDAQNINLWSATGSTSTEMSVDSSAVKEVAK